MNKRLICLILSLLMVAFCFAGCSQKTDDEAIENVNEEASESALTLAMYLMSESDISEEQASAIETAVNKITKSKFKTQLKLYFYTEDEYYEALEASFAARAEAQAAGLITSKPTDEEESTEEETFENEYGVSEIKYPTISGYQVDIFYLGGYDKFVEYMDMGMLERLDEELSSASKKLNSYMTTPYLTYMKSMNNGTYALPTNTAIGEYTYLLLNREVLKLQQSDTPAALKEFKSLTCDATKTFLANVDAYHGDYVPLYSCLGEDGLAISGVKYWGANENGELVNDFSVMASDYTVGAKYATTDSYMGYMGNVLTTDFKNQLKTLKYYKSEGYFGTEADLESGKAAVAYVKGGAEIPVDYSDKYEAVVIEKPTLTTEDLYKNMFAVSTYSTNLSRSMEIITYLNTNEDFRNLLLYGIEGENYELVDADDYLDEEGVPYKVVRRLNEDYMMDVNKTGNTLLAYTLEGNDPRVNEYAKTQNNDAVVSITMGFNLSYGDMTVDMTLFDKIRATSATVLEKLKAVTYDDAETADVDEFDAQIKEIQNYINTECGTAIGILADRSEPSANKSEDDPSSVGYMYDEWAIKLKIYTREVAE